MFSRFFNKPIILNCISEKDIIHACLGIINTKLCRSILNLYEEVVYDEMRVCRHCLSPVIMLHDNYLCIICESQEPLNRTNPYTRSENYLKLSARIKNQVFSETNRIIYGDKDLTQVELPEEKYKFKNKIELKTCFVLKLSSDIQSLLNLFRKICDVNNNENSSKFICYIKKKFKSELHDYPYLHSYSMSPVQSMSLMKDLFQRCINTEVYPDFEVIYYDWLNQQDTKARSN